MLMWALITLMLFVLLRFRIDMGLIYADFYQSKFTTFFKLLKP